MAKVLGVFLSIVSHNETTQGRLFVNTRSSSSSWGVGKVVFADMSQVSSLRRRRLLHRSSVSKMLNMMVEQWWKVDEYQGTWVRKSKGKWR